MCSMYMYKYTMSISVLKAHAVHILYLEQNTHGLLILCGLFIVLHCGMVIHLKCGNVTELHPHVYIQYILDSDWVTNIRLGTVVEGSPGELRLEKGSTSSQKVSWFFLQMASAAGVHLTATCKLYVFLMIVSTLYSDCAMLQLPLRRYAREQWLPTSSLGCCLLPTSFTSRKTLR